MRAYIVSQKYYHSLIEQDVLSGKLHGKYNVCIQK